MKLISTAIVATGDQVAYRNSKNRDFVTIQVTSADAASTTIIQGRMGTSHTWIDLETITGTGANTYATFKFFRVDVTATTGQVDADIADS